MSEKLTTKNILKTLRDTGRTAVIVVAALKGGVGKTTISMLMAIRYAIAGLRVLYVDADPSSQSGSSWAEDAEKSGYPLPITCEHWPHNKVGKNVNAVKDDYDIVIVDAGGDAAGVLGSAMAAATFLMLVTTANRADYIRIMPTLQASIVGAQQHENPAFADLSNVPCCVVMSRISSDQSKATVEAVRNKIGERIPVLDQTIRHWPNWYPGVFGNHPDNPELRKYYRRWSEIDGVIEEIAESMITREERVTING